MLLYFTRSPNLVIFVKVIFVIFDFENEKMLYKEYINIYIYLYILYRGEKVFLLLKMTKMTAADGELVTGNRLVMPVMLPDILVGVTKRDGF